MNTSSSHNNVPDVQEVAQSALHAWNEDTPTIGKSPRPNRLLRAIATAGAGALILSGCSVPETNTQPTPSETPFSTQGIEYVRVCQKVEDGTRAEDTSCEATESASPSPSPSVSESATASASPSVSSSATPSASPTSSPSNNNGGTNVNINNGGGGDTHGGNSGTNMFIWYYIGYMMGQNNNGGGGYSYSNSHYNGNVPAVGSSLYGGSTSMPNKGTVYQGVPSSGGSFADSYRAAKAKAGVKDGKVVTTERYNYDATLIAGELRSRFNPGFTTKVPGVSFHQHQCPYGEARAFQGIATLK